MIYNKIEDAGQTSFEGIYDSPSELPGSKLFGFFRPLFGQVHNLFNVKLVPLPKQHKKDCNECSGNFLSTKKI